jgi:LmbE family N-acetylglucosaminyl deacetylase
MLRRVLLAVFAHPDDESFGPGGTLARYCAEGVEVWLACATDGDAGTVDSETLSSFASTAQLRATELCCAAQVLGLKGIDFYAYRDSAWQVRRIISIEQPLQAPMGMLCARLSSLSDIACK